MAKPWTELVAQRIAGGEKNVPWWVNDKWKLHKFCSENGFPMPKLYEAWKTPDLLDLSTAPQEFVLKPSVMHSEQGVMILSRQEDGTFYDTLKKRTLTEDQIRTEQEKVYDKCKFKGSYRLMIEEKINGNDPGAPIPPDYKLYVFYNNVVMVQQIDRNTKPATIVFFDESFAPLELSGRVTSDWKHYHQGTPVVPQQWEYMLQIAADVTVALNTPFMRVDMFDSDHGPVIGELTPAPGGAYFGKAYQFTEQYDRELGQAWEDAEAEIEVSK